MSETSAIASAIVGAMPKVSLVTNDFGYCFDTRPSGRLPVAEEISVEQF